MYLTHSIDICTVGENIDMAEDQMAKLMFAIRRVISEHGAEVAYEASLDSAMLTDNHPMSR